MKDKEKKMTVSLAVQHTAPSVPQPEGSADLHSISQKNLQNQTNQAVKNHITIVNSFQKKIGMEPKQSQMSTDIQGPPSKGICTVYQYPQPDQVHQLLEKLMVEDRCSLQLMKHCMKNT